MKILIAFLLATSSLLVYGQEQDEAQLDAKARILLDKIKANNYADDDKRELKDIAYLLQNTGQTIGETYKDNKKSLQYTDKAIVLFNALKDTLNEANNRKFKGYLLGTLGEFSAAKEEVSMAINLFNLKKADYGIAVSKFDLSRVFECEHTLDSAIYYCDDAIKFWKEKDDTSRIFNNQNMLIHLLTKSKDYKRAKVVQKESEKLSANMDLYWQDLVDFYIVSSKLYKTAGQKTEFANYQKLYNIKIADLKKEGNVSSSYYDVIVN